MPLCLCLAAVLADEIKDELASRFFVDADQIQLSVHVGVATPTGTVDSMAKLTSAVENASEARATRVGYQPQTEVGGKCSPP